MSDIGSVGSDRGVDPANVVGSRRDTQGSATAYNTPNVEAVTVTNCGCVVSQNRHALRPQLPSRPKPGWATEKRRKKGRSEPARLCDPATLQQNEPKKRRKKRTRKQRKVAKK